MLQGNWGTFQHVQGWRLVRRFFVFCVFALLGCAAAVAQPAAPTDVAQDDPTRMPRGFFTFVWENDKFAGTDKNYTNGNRINFTRPSAEAGVSASIADMFLWGTQGNKRLLFNSWALGQSIYTPEDTQATAPLPGEHPYAGWLYGEASVISANLCRAPDETFHNCVRGAESIALQVGIVGPSAKGEVVQNNFHRLIGVNPARGWANQLHDEVGVNVLYDRRWQWQRWDLGTIHGMTGPAMLGVDLVPSYGWTAGNILTQASAGLTIRLGTGLNEMDLPARVRPSTPGAGLFGGTGFAWYLFASAEGRAVAHDIFLDGNTFHDSLSVDKRPFVADFQLGAVLRWNNLELTYTYVTRTEEFKTQGSAQQFGSVGITYRF